MSPSIRRREPRLWQIHSITVRQRDGPHRLRQAYRLLLSAPLPDASQSLSPEEETDAGRHLCTSLNRTPRARADDCQSGDAPAGVGPDTGA
jgi:hypothetical protein